MDKRKRNKLSKFFVLTEKPEDWKYLLADPEKHWKTGYSAKALAHCWQEANDFPRSVKRVFKQSGIPIFQDPKLLLAFPEYKVPLKPYRSRPSQNDIFILAKGNNELISITVEGKVDESFGETVGDWKLKDEGGKGERLKFLCQELKLDANRLDLIRYQLLHRTASAVIEAKTFNALNALMLVHAFQKTKESYYDSFRDYCQFLKLFGKSGIENSITYLKKINRVSLYAGWVKGESKYLEKADEYNPFYQKNNCKL